MITRWKLANYKSVRDETNVDLRPLTLFAGSNSSGKSTFLQSMLLISQTLVAKIPAQSVVLNGHLIKLGKFSDLRSFGSKKGRISIGWELLAPRTTGRALPSQGYSSPHATLSHDAPSRSYDSVACEISLNTHSRAGRNSLEQLQPTVTNCEVSCTSGLYSRRLGIASDTIYTFSARRRNSYSGNPPSDEIPEVPGLFESSSQESPSYNVKLDKVSLSELKDQLASGNPSGCHFGQILPEQLQVSFDRAAEEAKIVASAICTEGLRYSTRTTRSVEDRNIFIPPEVVRLLESHLGEAFTNEILNPYRNKVRYGAEHEEDLFGNSSPPTFTIFDWVDGVRRLSPSRRHYLQDKIQSVAQDLGPEIQKILETKGGGITHGFKTLPLPRALSEAARYANDFLQGNIKYLGPLRDEPKPLYSLSSSADPRDVGLRGENTAAVLHLHSSERIEYVPTDQFGSQDSTPDSSNRTLMEAVLDWARYLGIAAGVQTSDMGQLGHELRITSSEAEPWHDLTHVGVGVSQVLPILVMCLLARRGSVLLLEQPELHLHPKVQTRLADFFLSMSLLGKQCIVETHSEYLINRLRYRVAVATDEDLSSIIKMYFVEKQNGSSNFREVNVNEYGAITDWPEGFFDQSPRESENILRAAVAKKKRRREER